MEYGTSVGKLYHHNMGLPIPIALTGSSANVRVRTTYCILLEIHSLARHAGPQTGQGQAALPHHELLLFYGMIW